MSEVTGAIDACPHQNCGFRCCEFQQNNYIVLYPNELEEATRTGISTKHLDIIDDDYNGGKKAICNAKDTSCCDNGLKPADCKSYPFFPLVKDSDSDNFDITFIKGAKCPLVAEHLEGHQKFVNTLWLNLASTNSNILKWLTEVELVGYELFQHDEEADL